MSYLFRVRKDLIQCSIDGDTDEVRRLLENGDDPDNGTWPALAQASLYGHEECVEILIQHGADVNIVDGNGNTPLMFACQEGNMRCIQILIENGADPREVLEYPADYNVDEDILEILESAGLPGPKGAVK